MENKKAKVTKVMHNVRSYQTQNGTFYNHEITFDNGDRGMYSSKSDICQKFHEGQEASYTIETKQNGQYTNVIIKPSTEFVPGNTFAKKGSGSDESFALSYAKDFACSLLDSGKVVTAEMIIETADKFYNWLKAKK